MKLHCVAYSGVVQPRTRTPPLRLPLERSHEPPFIQNAIIRAVTVAMCDAMHHLMKTAASASVTGSDDTLAFYLFTRRRRGERRYRGISVHPILQKGHIYNLKHCAISFHAFFFFSASLKSRRSLSYKIACFQLPQ